MTKSKKTPPSDPQNKSFLKLAGEALSVLGHDIAEGKDKVVEVTGERITIVKEALGNLIHKKAAAKSPKKKAAAKSKTATAQKAGAKKAGAKKKSPAKKSVPAKKHATAKKTAPAKKKVAAKKSKR